MKKTHTNLNQSSPYELLIDVALQLRTKEDLFIRLQFPLLVSGSRFRALRIIESEPGITPSEVALKLGVTKASVTGLIQSLAKDGIITEKEHPADRRSCRLSPTAKGKTLLEKALPLVEQFRAVTLPDSFQVKGLQSLLSKLRSSGSAEAQAVS